MTAHVAICGAGAALAMAGHFPRRARLWVPHVLGLAAMVLAWLPAAQPLGAPVALIALAAVLVWQLCSGGALRARWAGAADTGAMAALIALSTVDPGTPGAGAAPMPGMHHAAATGTLPYAVAVLVVWLVVRHLTRDGGSADAGTGPDVVPGRRSGGRGLLGALRFCGGVVMLTTMTAMLA